jgi:hypothetical protein
MKELRNAIGLSAICSIATEGKYYHAYCSFNYLQSLKLRDIINRLYQKYLSRSQVPRCLDSDNITFDDKIALLWGGGRPAFSSISPSEIPNHEMEANSQHLPDLSQFTSILRRSSSYKSLLSAVARIQALQIPDPVASGCSIKEQFLSGMRLPSDMRGSLYTTVVLEFRVDWDFHSFHAEQKYSESLETVFETAITLTGNDNNVQAATCIDYVRQTWGDEGVELLLFLKKTITKPSAPSESSGQSHRHYNDASASMNISAD